MSKRIAIIGAGISGTNLGAQLSQHGFEVSIFEKSRGPGGRTSTRRYEKDGKVYSIDHGAQYIDVNSIDFQSFVDELEKNNVVEKFTKLGSQNTYVAVPAMNAVVKYLAQGLNLKSGVRVGSVERKNSVNMLYDHDNQLLGEFDFVISTAPPKQTAEFFQNFSEFDFLANIEMKAHFAIMLISSKSYDFGFTEINLKDSMLNWIGINSQKPQRGDDLAIIMHTNFRWSVENKDMDRELIAKLALAELEKETNFKDDNPIYLACHRWLYGRTFEPIGKNFIVDSPNNLACCGDYLLGDDIESAYISSTMLAKYLTNDVF
jgi:predicted NAD/FAD-dependent oxidoreductase